jgi:N-ethylmaleimide reductase
LPPERLKKFGFLYNDHLHTENIMTTSLALRPQTKELFSTIEIGPYLLPNRIVMAPMTRNRASPSGVPRPMTVTYYAQRATAGLIVTEAVQVSQQGQGYPAMPGLHSEEQVQAWKAVTQAVHEQGGRIFAQLFHGGRISHPSLQPGGAAPVAPSAIQPAGNAMTAGGPQPFTMPRALTLEEIEGVVADFALAAHHALESGFDGVELHAANGYLIDQFIRDGTNKRSDRYGGSAHKRVRFLLEVTDAVANAVGSERVGVRVSPINTYNDISDSQPQDTFRVVARALGRRELAYLHVVENGSDTPFDFARLRSQFSGRYIANGGYDYDRATTSLTRRKADLVSFGRPFIANPDLVQRLAVGALLNDADRATFYGGNERGYIDYPSLSDEAWVHGPERARFLPAFEVNASATT